ncbi:bifunctional (p)ppGpp synthetase/guanosine-3',5'-bis(diphosphate) 3'-pyrophosphohydrolase [Candidatus Woesearchaeota archaeon]|nr:bifunctional (p)ppGpp synthetase/guanosine-3',5'-bis(diphosphate) 3'-pyrophosphohydrolase [Candidatus Woesearchaeota archaeon]
MKLTELIQEVLAYNPKADINLIRKAYILAEKAHKGQKREGGEEYFSHPIEVARILINLKADSSTICAALLHDTVEDTNISIEKVKELFDEEIADLVEGLTKFNKIQFETREDYTYENLRKILLATAKDIRVMLIKLADRLHNMRTLKYVAVDKQKRIAKETIEIYAPIAHKLGMWRVKGELEDLSLRFLEPDVYKFLRNKISEKREEREKHTAEIIKEIKKQLLAKQIESDISGRAKYFYSIYKKMKQKNIGFNEIYDLIAVRIIVKTIPDCYSALGLIHDLYKPIPHRFKDYISVPKSNDYQSLHTTVITDKGKILEFQIRTREMHYTAEDGIAAHWRYKGTERDKMFDKKISWLKQLLEWRNLSSTSSEFIETLKIDLFEDEIVVFTPKGDPISLPKESTPVDFAYMVHSSIGDYCSKAMVNNKIMPLDTSLESGDIVEIITNKGAKPSRQWLKFVKTNKARSKIKANLKMEIETTERDDEEETMPADIAKAIQIVGKKAPLKISKCCHPKLYEPIVGFYTKDKKITIHKKTCPNIHALDKNKEVPVLWTEDRKLPVMKISLTLADKVGALARVLNIIASYKINIKNITTKPRKDNVITTMYLEVDNKIKMKDMLNELKKVDAVLNINEIK